MTADIEKLLVEVKAFIQPVKERTLFSLGGRGYYENPASDLLAFFLRPEAEHGFGSLFLQAFLDCMQVSSRDLSFTGVTVSRETQTKEGNRIDLVIQGPDWVLLIENKVYHDPKGGDGVGRCSDLQVRYRNRLVEGRLETVASSLPCRGCREEGCF